MAIKVVHKADIRGTSTLGWLYSRHSFSFGNYNNPDNIHFGALRAINDEMLAPDKGYGAHPHSNMEIITIPLSGNIEYKDDKNNHAIIGKDEIQVLSAGTGVFHTEKNPNKDCSAQYLQIWILPHLQRAKSRYQKIKYNVSENSILEIVSPTTEKDKLSINQMAWLSLGNISNSNHGLNYSLHQPTTHAVYIFIIKGEIKIDGDTFTARDGIGINKIECIEIRSPSTSDFLIIEIPMKV